MDRSVFDTHRWRELDFLALEQFSKATEEDPEQSRAYTQAYLLKRFNNAAALLLHCVIDLDCTSEYEATLNHWCVDTLPGLERPFRLDDEALAKKTEELLGPVVNRGKLTEQIAYWKRKAITRARFIHDGLRQIQSKRPEGRRVAACLRGAYDLYTSEIDDLTEAFLTESIPSMVFRAAVGYKWVPYPPIRSTVRRVAGNFHQGWHNPSHYETVPQDELTETFGGYKVPNGYAAWFTRNLESRIEYWRSVAKQRAAASDPTQPERAGSIPSVEDAVPALPTSVARRESSNNTSLLGVVDSPDGLETPEGRKAATDSWKRRWSTPDRKCTNDDLTEVAFASKDRSFLNQWQNGKTRRADPSGSARVQSIENVLRKDIPPKWHPLAKRSPS